MESSCFSSFSKDEGGEKKKKKKTGKEKLPMLHQQQVWTWFLEQENLSTF